jgi:hypothetical protein
MRDMTNTEHKAPDEAPDDVSEALTLLEAAGYTTNFFPKSQALHCTACGSTPEPEHVVVDRIFRFEGVSNPDDEAIVLALRCPVCQAKGVMVTAYGPSADPDDIDVLLALTDGRAEA